MTGDSAESGRTTEQEEWAIPPWVLVFTLAVAIPIGARIGAEARFHPDPRGALVLGALVGVICWAAGSAIMLRFVRGDSA